jgi:hypothetical protein
MSGTANSEASNSTTIDTPSFFAACIIVVLLLAALWVFNHLLGSMEEVKKTAEILLPVAAIPGYNAVSNFIRKWKTAPAGGVPADESQNLFSPAFVIALILIFLFEFLSFLSGVAGGMIIAQNPPADAAKSAQAVGSAIQIIGFLVTTPVMLLFCGTAGWMLARSRVPRPLRFSLYFFVSAAVLSTFDIALVVLDSGTQQMFGLKGTAEIVGFTLGALLVRPFFLSLALLTGFYLRMGWRAIARLFSGRPSGAPA